MLFFIGHVANKRLASTAFVTSSRNTITPYGAKKVPFHLLGISKIGLQTNRKFAVASRLNVKATGTSAPKAAKKNATTKKPTTKSTSTSTKSKSKGKAKPLKAKGEESAKKRTPKAKRPMSEKRRITLERQALKKTALFNEPKNVAINPWNVYLGQQLAGLKIQPSEMKFKFAELSSQFKNLSDSELKAIEETAENNKRANVAAHKAWVETHSPSEIQEANKARTALKKKHNFPTGKVRLIRDDRAPKRPMTAYFLFLKARYASGEYSNSGSVGSTAKALGEEWRGLSPAERQPYEDLQKAEHERYAKEVADTFNRPVAKRRTP
ncbi:hypothetical protein F5Y15DRAFT_18227 [Xylariaceae sp. FL0016]|nr:hypothetical protein F5Y15DRAFT_18227 [Xylariaceae sp. FL0016]